MTAKQDNLDPQTRDLVRFAAAIAQGYEPELRERVGPLRSSQVPVSWVEELILQSVLMCGYPRALVAFMVWRKFGAVPAPQDDPEARYDNVAAWTARGEETCALIYGDNYLKLRDSVRVLHPALDGWMITEGYGRTLARPGLDLTRRELCTVAQTAVLETLVDHEAVEPVLAVLGIASVHEEADHCFVVEDRDRFEGVVELRFGN